MPALTPKEAAQVILARLSTLPVELVSLRDTIGRTLRRDVYGERDNPPFDRVCMDGVAIASVSFANGTRQYSVQGTQAAGALPLSLASPSSAIEVMTGAVLPAGTDTIVPLEEYSLDGSDLRMNGDASAAAWRNVQRRGSDSRPDVAMLKAGHRIGAAEVAVLASAGLAQVEVSRLPRVRVVSTGDELVEPGQPIESHQIRRSNAYGIVAALRAHGYSSVGDDHLPDDEALTRDRLGLHLESNDVVVLSGGVSTGKYDFVPAALRHLGVEEVFYQVAQRPGRPMWFGVGPRGQAVFGLPGNPVATMICVSRFVLPALRSITGTTVGGIERIRLANAWSGKKHTYYLPVTLGQSEDGQWQALARPPQGSGDFLALAGTDGFVELPPRANEYPAGFVSDLYRW